MERCYRSWRNFVAVIPAIAPVQKPVKTSSNGFPTADGLLISCGSCILATFRITLILSQWCANRRRWNSFVQTVERVPHLRLITVYVVIFIIYVVFLSLFGRRTCAQCHNVTKIE
jgi:amino acid permease